jgi:serine/threonine protein kinase
MKSRVASLPVSAVDDSRPLEPDLEQLIEATAARLQAGEAVDLDQLIAAHPEYADQLRELLPAVDMLVRMGNAPAEPASGPPATNGHPPSLPHQQLGGFRLLRELGRGGMGTVYEAEQLSMDRHVALKVLPFAALVDDKSRQRFRNEVRAAAALDHPNIVSVYSVGEERGVHYYAMQLIRGQTLADLIHEMRKKKGPGGDDVPTIDSATSSPHSTKRDTQAHVSTAADSRRAAEFYRSGARLGIQAAEALQHAHDQGVLHRDIKPGNLMLDGDGHLYITDFGLARIEADAGLTMTGDIVGTLRYMAPEQALAKRVVIDHRADVYSLGATLYELLTLQPAYCETDRSELLKLIAFEEPLPPRKLDRRIPAELETVVLKAMAKSPDERYQSAQQLADDLQAFLEHRPIKAKPPTLLNRAGKWSRRNRGLTVAAAVVAVVSLMFTSAIVADRWRQVSEGTQFVRDALRAASAALKANDVPQALQRAGEAQTRVAANRLSDLKLIDEVAALSDESKRYAKFSELYKAARSIRTDDGIIVAPAREALALYQVMEDPRWFETLKQAGFPDAHTDRVNQAVYELLLQNADELIRWQIKGPEATRQARLESQCREAIRCLDKATSFHSPSRGYYWLLANCSLITGDKDKEKQLRETALQTAPHDAAELFYINRDRVWGTVSKNRGYPEYPFEENYKDHREMLRLDPTYYNALFFMARRLSGEGRKQEALVALFGCLSYARMTSSLCPIEPWFSMNWDIMTKPLPMPARRFCAALATHVPLLPLALQDKSFNRAANWTKPFPPVERQSALDPPILERTRILGAFCRNSRNMRRRR